MTQVSMANNPFIKQQAYIDGQWVGLPALAVTDPATGAEIACVPDMGAEETRKAIEAAHRAFPAWAKLLAKDRSAILRRWYDLILQNADALGELLTKEQGKPLAEGKGEIIYGANFIEFYAEEAKRVCGEIIPTHKADARILVLRQPVGVVAAITPWNFPNAMITRKIAPALAAGCTVVCKPAEDTPLSALALMVLAEKAGFPKGVINMVTTARPEVVGAEMTSNPLVSAVTFTGSTEVGKILMKQSAPTLKKVMLELGGNAPFIVFDDADLEAAVAGAISSKFRNMGQTCVCTNRFFVQDKIYDAFTEKFAAAMKQLKVGNGLEVGVTQGPLINKAAIDKVKAHVADAASKGARILVGGKPDKLGGTFFEPTLIADVTPDMLITQEETFGPVAPLVRFKSEEEVIRLANATPFGLAGYFYARDLGRVWRVAEALEYGMISVNSGVFSTEVAPFGGIKQSGFGREGSHYGIEELTDLKYVLMAGI
jgi:succinate-semialdehyde dehydrogenase/glutarate-semialdehyde dehydrogenase